MQVFFSQAVHGRQRVGKHRLVTDQVPLCKVGNIGLGNTVYNFHGQKTRMFATILASEQHRRLTLGTTPALSRALASHQRIIDFHPIGQLISATPIAHGNAQLTQHPAVREVAVFGIPSEKWGETPLAAVILHQPHAVSAESLCDWINQRVEAGYQRVQQVIIKQDFPRNAAGKTLKRVMRDEYWNEDKLV